MEKGFFFCFGFSGQGFSGIGGCLVDQAGLEVQKYLCLPSVGIKVSHHRPAWKSIFISSPVSKASQYQAT